MKGRLDLEPLPPVIFLRGDGQHEAELGVEPQRSERLDPRLERPLLVRPQSRSEVPLARRL